MEDYEYGQPIPERYRCRLFDWEGGGYEGCFFEPNVGIVDKDGHWHPIVSTGRKGIDDCGWYDKKIGQLKSELGYDVTPAKCQFDEALRLAVKKVFGEDWYMKSDDDGAFNSMFEDPRVKELTKKDGERYAEFCKNRDEYRIELEHRLDFNFMEAMKRDFEDERPQEIGLMDSENAKETCRLFCDKYSRNVGFFAHVMDKLANMGYETWFTCTDCGKQFQAYEYKCNMDNNAYHGDGGIGVIMTRILCDDCMDEVRCGACGDPDLPNLNSKDKGESDWRNYDFMACFLHDWLNVCWGCADGYGREYLEYYSHGLGRWVETELGEKVVEIVERLESRYEMEGHELYKEMLKTEYGLKKINELRDMLEKTVREHFDNLVDCDWFEDRKSIEKAEQGTLAI